MELFAGFKEKSGRTVILVGAQPDPVTRKLAGRSWTVNEGPSPALWEAHLSGTMGLGVIPVDMEGVVSFGAIDVDLYPLDFKGLAQKIKKWNMPLVMAQTKSGGAHLYLFTTAPIPSVLMISTLRAWAAVLGYRDHEVYPKQTKVLDGSGDSANWLNMPYFGRNSRMGMDAEGTVIEDLGEWVEYAQSKRVTKEFLERFDLKIPEALPGGPPCLQALCSSGFPAGTRNAGLFSLAVYAKMAGGDEWQAMTEKFNNDHMSPPLPAKEVLDVIKHVGKKDYFYKCNDAPLKSFCNKTKCRKCEFGIGNGENEDADLPELSGLVRLNSDPAIWYVDVNGSRVRLDTESITSPSKFQVACMGQNVHVPLIKKSKFDAIRGNLMQSMLVVEASADATIEGTVRDVLCEWLDRDARTHIKEDLALGRPVKVADALNTYYFRLGDLVQELVRKRYTSIGRNLVSAILQEWKLDLHRGRHGCQQFSFYEIRLDRVSDDLPAVELPPPTEDPY